MLVTTVLVTTASTAASLSVVHTTQLAGQWMEAGINRIRFTDQPNPEQWTSQRRLSSPQAGALMTINSSGIEGQA